jgi:hypothetical protein
MCTYHIISYQYRVHLTDRWVVIFSLPDMFRKSTDNMAEKPSPKDDKLISISVPLPANFWEPFDTVITRVNAGMYFVDVKNQTMEMVAQKPMSAGICVCGDRHIRVILHECQDGREREYCLKCRCLLKDSKNTKHSF